VTKQPMEFGGVEHFSASQPQVYGLLTDLQAMATIIPDLVSSEQVDDRTLKCVVKPGFSFLRGTLRLTITLGDCQPSESATMRVEAQGIGVGMSISSQLRILPEDSGSRLDWQARIDQVKGLISAVSPTLIKAAADQVIRNSWSAVRAKLGE
jgi:carbon monoxide dehydrogenase subunit G